MAKALYIVLHSRGQWWIDLEGRAFGPFANREAARREAIDLAQFLSHTGRASEVMVPDDAGAYRLVWESAREPSLARGLSPAMPASLRAGPVPRQNPVLRPVPSVVPMSSPAPQPAGLSARVEVKSTPASRVSIDPVGFANQAAE